MDYLLDRASLTERHVIASSHADFLTLSHHRERERESEWAELSCTSISPFFKVQLFGGWIVTRETLQYRCHKRECNSFSITCRLIGATDAPSPLLLQWEAVACKLLRKEVCEMSCSEKSHKWNLYPPASTWSHGWMEEREEIAISFPDALFSMFHLPASCFVLLFTCDTTVIEPSQHNCSPLCIGSSCISCAITRVGSF